MSVSSLRMRLLQQGFACPWPVLTPSEHEQTWAGFRDYQARFGQAHRRGGLEGDARFRVHLLARWAHDVVHHPALVGWVQQALDSPDIVCWSSDLNIKPAQSASFFSWHQDSTYAGLSPPEEVITAWVALTHSTPESGCVAFLPDTHWAQYAHEKTQSQDNLLAFGQTIQDQSLIAAKEASKVEGILAPGQASFHAFRCIHGGGANKSSYDRVGLAIRYMTPRVAKCSNQVKERVTWVSGSRNVPHFDLELCLESEEDYSEKRWSEHALSMEMERTNYFVESTAVSFNSDARLETFRQWPRGLLHMDPRKLAEAGFYYTGVGDAVLCYYCGVGLNQWEPRDDPWDEHELASPHCGFVNLCRSKPSLSSRGTKLSYLPNNEGSISPQKVRKIQEEHEELLEESRCKICLGNPSSVLFQPCRHFATCPSCAIACQTCPICRQTVESFLRVVR